MITGSKEFLKRFKKGFTLLELTVSIFVFGIAVTFLVSTYIVSQETEQAALAYVNAIENLRATIENMARDIRTGLNFPDTASPNSNPQAVSSLAFTDRLNRNIDFCLATCQFSSKQCIKKSINAACTATSTDYITASDIDIKSMNFYVYNSDCTDNPLDQPRIVAFINAVAPFKDQDIQLGVQTTITPRLLKSCKQ